MDQKQYWEQKDRSVYKTWPISDFAKEVIQYFPKQAKILELGCGVGTDAAFFASQNVSVIATDFNETGINENSQQYASIANLTFAVVDISKPLPFAAHSFDVVYAKLSLHYFSDAVTKAVFTEINRVLRPNGIVAFSCKSIFDPQYGEGKLLEKDMFIDEGHIRHFFTEDYVKACLNTQFHPLLLRTVEKIFDGKPASFVEVVARVVH